MDWIVILNHLKRTKNIDLISQCINKHIKTIMEHHYRCLFKVHDSLKCFYLNTFLPPFFVIACFKYFSPQPMQFFFQCSIFTIKFEYSLLYQTLLTATRLKINVQKYSHQIPHQNTYPNLYSQSPFTIYHLLNLASKNGEPKWSNLS